MNDDEKWIRLERMLIADREARICTRNLISRMDNIDHTSSEKDYQIKLRWLSFQGKGGEMREMIENRSSWNDGDRKKTLDSFVLEVRGLHIKAKVENVDLTISNNDPIEIEFDPDANKGVHLVDKE